MKNGRFVLPFIFLFVFGGSPTAGANSVVVPSKIAKIQQERDSRVRSADRYMGRHLGEEKLASRIDADYSYARSRATPDTRGRWHVHYRQEYDGIPVIGGGWVVHMDEDGTPSRVTQNLIHDMPADTRRLITDEEARRLVSDDFEVITGKRPQLSSRYVIYPVVSSGNGRLDPARGGRRERDYGPEIIASGFRVSGWLDHSSECTGFGAHVVPRRCTFRRDCTEVGRVGRRRVRTANTLFRMGKLLPIRTGTDQHRETSDGESPAISAD